MRKTKPFRALIERMPPERRARIQLLKHQYEQEMMLEEIRQALDKTQIDLAEKLKTSQANISKLEKRADMLLSTLQTYVRALGGDLVLHAYFPGIGDVRLKGLGELRREIRQRHRATTH